MPRKAKPKAARIADGMRASEYSLYLQRLIEDDEAPPSARPR